MENYNYRVIVIVFLFYCCNVIRHVHSSWSAVKFSLYLLLYKNELTYTWFMRLKICFLCTYERIYIHIHIHNTSFCVQSTKIYVFRLCIWKSIRSNTCYNVNNLAKVPSTTKYMDHILGCVDIVDYTLGFVSFFYNI